jgi:glutathione synthase/RimK-type ligase-like ATP-grasp enzyme
VILILSNKQDSHSDEVIRRLTLRGIPTFRLNTEDLLTKYQLNMGIDDGTAWYGRIVDETGRELNLTNLKVAWFRKPDFDFSTGFDGDSDATNFATSEARAFIEMLYSLPTVNWINDPFVSSKSKVKFQQLILATELGMKIPKTIITNEPDEALSFFLECGNSVLAKAIYTSNVRIDGVSQGIPSQRVDRDIFYESYKNVKFTPTQFQEYVEKDFELRVTVIGDRVWAIKIESQLDDRTRTDWRVATRVNPHSIYELPKVVRRFCKRFLERQSLVYGAMDFIVTPGGDCVFLENNPFGQYLWLETETGIPLTDAMCDLLAANAGIEN